MCVCTLCLCICDVGSFIVYLVTWFFLRPQLTSKHVLGIHVFKYIVMKHTHFLQQTRQYRFATTILFFTFVGMLFLYSCLFHYFSTYTSFFSCFIHPKRIFSIYMQKMSISVFLGAFIFLFKRKYWTLYALVINAIWILAELVYMQSFDYLLIDEHCFSMIGNLNGFTSSILMYIDSNYLWLVVPIIIQGIALFVFDNRQKHNWWGFFAALIVSIILNFAHILFIRNTVRTRDFQDGNISIASLWNPITTDSSGISNPWYTHNYSEKHAFFAVFYRLLFRQEEKVDTEELNHQIYPFIDIVHNNPKPKTKLVIFLVESLENWALLPEISPNICNLMNNPSALYATKIKKQTLKGNSMDGQTIVNTGVLPIKEGAACFRYPYNSYPSISQLYDSAAVLVPGGVMVWNQAAMSRAFYIDTNYVVPFNDADIFQKFDSIADKHDYILVITSSTHTPFSSCADSSDLVFPAEMPLPMCNYLKSVNFMDKWLGHTLTLIRNNPAFINTTFVITGDHTIFTNKYRELFAAYCETSNSSQFKVKEGFCPLIIYSPQITENTIVTDTCFQMDIYPTILHLIGCEDYYWKGFGINLLDSTAHQNRPISEQEAFDISDKLIRSNYFATIDK